jgi:DivIVA domain-containing protein
MGMADSNSGEIPTQRFQRPAATAAERIRDVEFPVVAMRGYDRRAVDQFVDQMIELVSELEGRQSREAVVQRALDEVGEETAGILQRAHETADEIAARSRAQAEGRLQRAEREAEIMRRDADAYAEQVVVDTRLLWEERQRLIEDIRQLADEVLATADDAIERVKMPEPLREPERGAADSPTSEVELDLLPGGAADGTDELEPVADELTEGEPTVRTGAAGGQPTEGESTGGEGDESSEDEPAGRSDRGSGPEQSEAADDDALAKTRRPTPGGD